MKNDYYNKELYNKICDTFQENPFISEIMFSDYIELYSQDYSAKIKYIENLIIIGKFDQAKTFLEAVEESYAIDYKFKNAKGNYLYLFEHSLLFTKLKLYMYTQHYEDAYYLLKSHPREFRKIFGDYLNIELYLDKKLGLQYPKNVPDYYNYQQIISYDKGKFYETIKKFYLKNNTEEKKIYFDDDFPIDIIVKELNSLIPNDKCLYNGIIDNHYYFLYNSCGYNNGIKSNFFSVVCYDKSNEFITMYPTTKKEKFPYIDLNYLNYNDLSSQKRIKKLSQIDKFKIKYNYKDVEKY